MRSAKERDGPSGAEGRDRGVGEVDDLGVGMMCDVLGVTADWNWSGDTGRGSTGGACWGEVAGEGADKVALLAGQGIGIGIGVDGGMEEGGGEELAERDKLEGVLPAGQMGEEAATAPVDPKGLLEGGGGGSEGGKMKPEVDVALLHEVGTEVGVAFGTSEAEALDEARMTKDEIVESFIVGVGHD